MTKSEIREKFLRERKFLLKNKNSVDQAICQKIIPREEFKESCHIALYAADDFEVNLRAIFEKFCSEKSFYYPRYNYGNKLYDMVKVMDFEKDLVIGKYGILEPRKELEVASVADLKSMLFLVPGVAFDDSCQRLGRGKGFYDRLLLNKKFSIGVFYERQRADKIPVELHDIALDMIVTEERIYKN